MKTPFGLAGIDSAGALLNATARALRGEDFPAMGHPEPLQYLVRASDLLPVKLRRRIYAAATGFEAIPRHKVHEVDMQQIARWATSMFPGSDYPVAFIGSSSGALAHLATLLGAPVLPQTFMIGVRRKGGGIDDPKGDLDQARAAGLDFLDANRDVQLHHMHDPSQDRLSLRYITYFRPKYRRLPSAYRDFLSERIAPGGTVVISECTKRWPTRRVAERYHFQFGAVGGMEPKEYFEGSARVAAYLEHYDTGLTRWDPPEPDDEGPEAEWGFETALREEIVDLARARGLNVLRLTFEEPDDLSPLVADFHRDLYRRHGRPDDRLLVSSFILIEPLIALRTGQVPYWATFNSGHSYDRLQAYIHGADPYDEIGMMIFPHGTESVGLPGIGDWRALLGEARRSGRFVGVNENAYPHHFSALARYHIDAARMGATESKPVSATIAEFEAFRAAAGAGYAARISDA